MRRTLSLASLFAIATVWITEAHAASENWLGVENSKLRSGDIEFSDIPKIIINVTNYVVGLSGTIAMIMIIYGAVRMQIGSLSNDKETGKKIMFAGVVGFVFAISGWFIIRVIMDNLANPTV